MDEINLIRLHIPFRLIIIRLEYLFWLTYSHYFPNLMLFLFLTYFVLHGALLLLFLIEYGFATHGVPDLKKDLGIL